ncbi:ribosome-inactivating family protein [Streptomyces sp. NPDC006430]|uniref:ribosome-inactivating family protein n=1 Tax=Streptomyces sp. NPDC006430 TaxID=3154299 RepID=UPI0033A3F354
MTAATDPPEGAGGRGSGPSGGTAHYLPLRIQAGGLFVELYVCSSDFRIVGFRNVFEDGQAPPEAYFRCVQDSLVPPGIHRAEVLPFEGGCSALERAASVQRASIPLGRRPMSCAILRLHQNTDPMHTAHGMLVLTQMLCEPAQFPALADEVSRIWVTGGPWCEARALRRA